MKYAMRKRPKEKDSTVGSTQLQGGKRRGGTGRGESHVITMTKQNDTKWHAVNVAGPEVSRVVWLELATREVA